MRCTPLCCMCVIVIDYKSSRSVVRERGDARHVIRGGHPEDPKGPKDGRKSKQTWMAK